MHVCSFLPETPATVRHRPRRDLELSEFVPDSCADELPFEPHGSATPSGSQARAGNSRSANAWLGLYDVAQAEAAALPTLNVLLTRARACTQTHRHTHTHALARTRTHTHTHTHTHTRSHTQTLTRTHRHPQAVDDSDSYTHPRARMHTHRHQHRHTNTHVHTQTCTLRDCARMRACRARACDRACIHAAPCVAVRCGVCACV
jgi:hypothetical protein